MKRLTSITFVLSISFFLGAQEGALPGLFSGADAGASPVSVPNGPGGAAVGGEAVIGASFYIGDLDSPGNAALGDLTSARLDFRAPGAMADAFLRLRLSRQLLATDVARMIDEAYVTVHGPIAEFQGGLMKQSWGKADSQGPLDVTNPSDFSDLTVTDALERKISRPMLRTALSLGAMTRLEGLFVPNFAGNAYATEGEWKPRQIDEFDRTLEALGMGPNSFASMDRERTTLGDFQGGARLTSTAGSVDWGLQYYYGMFAEPSIAFSPPASFTVTHDRFHQAGADFAAVLFGSSVRGEAAAFITEDLRGDDPAIRNPEFRFTLGCDREIPGGISLNAQYSSRTLLRSGEISSRPDVQKDADPYTSQWTVKASRGFLKDSLVFEASAIWEIEEADYLFMPSVTYKVGDASLELASGLFGGKNGGTLGQYRDSSYLKAGVSYAF